jgi:predicted membrane protein
MITLRAGLLVLAGAFAGFVLFLPSFRDRYAEAAVDRLLLWTICGALAGIGAELWLRRNKRQREAGWRYSLWEGLVALTIVSLALAILAKLLNM